MRTKAIPLSFQCSTIKSQQSEVVPTTEPERRQNDHVKIPRNHVLFRSILQSPQCTTGAVAGTWLLGYPAFIDAPIYAGPSTQSHRQRPRESFADGALNALVHSCSPWCTGLR